MSVLLSAWLIGSQVFHASWGAIDDHDTLKMIGAGNHHLPLGQYLQVLFTQTELGQIGAYPRFRPFYYPALLGEAVLWGDNVHLWYASRVGLLAIFIAGIWIPIARHLGIIISLCFVLSIMRMPFWGDVWARLGPGEIYAAAGLGGWVAGIDAMFAGASERLRRLGMFSVSLGTLIMVGSKETLFPFAGYSICAFVAFIYLHRQSVAAKIHLVLVLAYSAATAAAIGLALRGGEDILGRPAGLSERLTQIVAPFASSLAMFVLPAIVLLAVTAAIARWRRPVGSSLGDSWLKPAITYIAGVVWLWSLYLSQYIGYNGQWPTGYRYDFPGVFAAPALVVISVMFLAAVTRPYPLASRAVRGAAMTAALVSIVISIMAMPFPLANSVKDNIDHTARFQKALANVAALAKKDPDLPIILRANGAWTYEKIVSVAIYLHNYYKVANPIAVKFYSDGNSSPQFLALAEAIKRWERDGGREQFVPLGSVAERAKLGCLSIGLDGPGEPDCRGDASM
ncbi:hypothetical protein QA641_16585 [Bradyrhizobium sp. CB1650]|uniref:hypothetical protein n=1 Tax=Bradyrhizobium sp. CB1650 TaxID=3039153 RepID=UPI0024359E62|nr:hypothetical protein [Bradyrhizobium sp. CB1650]WGD55344.1 hypothetical protein QA641_16585 [Bradyrhizobium sp. CB1650]